MLMLIFAPATAAPANINQRGDVRVDFQGDLTPRDLPRSNAAPVRVSLRARITGAHGAQPPQLRRIAIAFNRNGGVNPGGLPICHRAEIQPASSADALRSCRDSLVGKGTFTANVLLPQQSPFPAEGQVFAFNSVVHGEPAILFHVYGTQPLPTSYTLPFFIRRSQGTYGTALVAYLPPVTANWGDVTGLSMTLGRRFSLAGRPRSYFSAACPAPAGFPGAVFPFARARFSFAGQLALSNTVTRSCTARE
jgi:hypothetical protein